MVDPRLTGAVEADPNAPPTTPRPDGAGAAEGTVHDIELVIEEDAMTVAEGFVQKVWTFNGNVPGPVIRVQSATPSGSTSSTRRPARSATRSTSTPARSPGMTR